MFNRRASLERPGVQSELPHHLQSLGWRGEHRLRALFLMKRLDDDAASAIIHGGNLRWRLPLRAGPPGAAPANPWPGLVRMTWRSTSQPSRRRWDKEQP